MVRPARSTLPIIQMGLAGSPTSDHQDLFGAMAFFCPLCPWQLQMTLTAPFLTPFSSSASSARLWLGASFLLSPTFLSILVSWALAFRVCPHLWTSPIHP